MIILKNQRLYGNIIISQNLDKPKDAKQFCNSSIEGIKNVLSNEYKFYLKENHTDIYVLQVKLIY